MMPKGCSWRRAQARVNAFWRVWRQEYITLLHNQSKWQRTRKDIQVGNLVLLVKEVAHRGEWKLGRVVSDDGTANHVRKAEVRRADGRIVLKDEASLAGD